MSSIEQMVPTSLLAEEAVLGCILLDPRALTQVVDVLTPAQFSFEHCRLVYESMLHLFTSQQIIDPISVNTELDQRGCWQQVNDRLDLVDLSFRVGSSYQVEYYAKQVVEAWSYREMIQVSAQLAQDAYNKDSEALEKAQSALYKISGGQGKEDAIVSHRSEVGRYLGQVLEALEDRGVLPGISTGFPALDKKTGGLRKGGYFVIGGRPGEGKTVAGLNIADAAVRAGCTALYYSMEMTRDELMARWASMVACVDGTHLRDNMLNEYPGEIERIVEAHDIIAGFPGQLFIDDTSSNTDVAMRARAMRLQVEYGLDLIIVDYLQLARHAGDSGKRLERRLELGEISRNLKNLARDLKVPVLALAQLNRESANEKRRPRLSDFRECGDIENDADVAALIYRPLTNEAGEPLDPTASEYDIQLCIEKNRHGSRGTVDLHFVGKYTKLYPIRYKSVEVAS